MIGELYSCISDFKKGYQPRTNIVKDEKGDWVTDFHSILARWWNHFSQLLNVHGVIDVRQTEIHTEEPIVSEFCALELEIAIDKLNRHKSPDIDQIPAEFIKVGVEQFTMSSVNLLILFGITNCLRKRSLYLFIRRVIKQTSNY